MSNPIKKREVFVFADWDGLSETKFLGVLYAELIRGKEIFSFQYNEDWLSTSQVQLLDPDLNFYPGIQYLADEKKANFGLFLDSSPDRWGRILMRRREAVLARIEQRSEKKLFELDYLLGVYDDFRMGGLRFKSALNGEYLNNSKMTVPPWTSLPELAQISLKLEEDEDYNDQEYLNWLNTLIAPGSSIGGARPKANISDQQGQLWIAKFPSKSDQENIGAWEMVVHELALSAGLNVPQAKMVNYGGKFDIYLSRRFDRNPLKRRIHFASAMTLLGHIEGENHQQGVSYLEIAEFIQQHGTNVLHDLEELWRRIAFNICVSNTDDHLRNHGFIFKDNGWILSPAYDLNPNESSHGLSLNISENDNSLSLDLVMEVGQYFRINEKLAKEIIQRIKDVVKNWRKYALKYNIPKNEIELKANAFMA